MTDKFAGTLVGVNTFHLRRRPNFTPNVDDSTWRAWARRPRISFHDADAVATGITGPVVTAWQSSDRTTVEGRSKKMLDVEVTAASERYFDIKNLRIAEGRPFAIRGTPYRLSAWPDHKGSCWASRSTGSRSHRRSRRSRTW